jgi:hypothetical protein
LAIFCHGIHPRYIEDSLTKILYDWGYVQIILLSGFSSLEVQNKDPTVWLDGARLSPKYSIAQSKNNFGGQANFCQRIHPIYIVDSLTYYADEAIVRGIHLSG